MSVWDGRKDILYGSHMRSMELSTMVVEYEDFFAKVFEYLLLSMSWTRKTILKTIIYTLIKSKFSSHSLENGRLYRVLFNWTQERNYLVNSLYTGIVDDAAVAEGFLDPINRCTPRALRSFIPIILHRFEISVSRLVNCRG